MAIPMMLSHFAIGRKLVSYMDSAEVTLNKIKVGSTVKEFATLCGAPLERMQRHCGGCGQEIECAGLP